MKTRCFAVIAAITTAMTAFAAVAPGPKPGDQSRWSLDFRVRLEQHDAPPVDVHLQGEWSSTVVALHPGQYDAQLQISDLHFTGDAVKTATAASLDDLRLRLSRPFWATYRNDGGLLAVHFFRDVAPSDCNLLQMIATELQLVRPDAVRPSWTAQERDGAGEYAALYVMAQPNRITKRKLKYFYTDGAAGPIANTLRIGIDDSNTTFSVASDGSLQAADGASRMHIDFSLDNAQQLATVTEIHLSDRRVLRASELVDSLARSLPNVTSSAIVTHQTDPAALRAQADDRLLDGRSTESLIAAVFMKSASDDLLPDRLAALFRRRPESADAATAALKVNGSQRQLTNALAIADTSAAVAALSTLARESSLSENLRVDALTAFLEIHDPDPKAMRVPVDLMDDANPAVRSAAQLISGALARAGRASHSVEAQAIDASLIALYHKAHDMQEMTDLLRALGNSAGPSIVAVIEEALRDSHSPVRAAATRALRLEPGSEIDSLLARLISSDHDPIVRSNAIFAAGFRHPLPGTIAEALVQAASNDSVDYVRSNAIALLRHNPNAAPGISEVLERIADRDSNAGIRRQAGQALASIGQKPSPKP